MKRTEEHLISDSAVVEAVQIRCSRVFPALNIANAFAGAETDAWWAIRTYSLVELLAEADRRGISFAGVKSAVPGGDTDPLLLVDCPVYQRARGVC